MSSRGRNILFIVIDDLNSWIEPLGGHPQVKTPFVNELAERGTIFANAYCAAPYCNASRLAVFTGQAPHESGVYHNEPYLIRSQTSSLLMERLRDAGYRTFSAGKVFHGTFDYEKATRERSSEAPWRAHEDPAGLWEDYHPPAPEPLPPHRPLNRMFDFSDPDRISSWNLLLDWGPIPSRDERNMPDQIAADAAIGFLGRTHRQPFFCAVGLYKPHLPWYSPQRFRDLYPYNDIILPLMKPDDLDDKPEIAKVWARTPPDHDAIIAADQWRHAVRGYLASISYCDHLVGEILSALDQTPYRDNTTVILWSDNGFHLGEKLHWRKFVLWEEATRVPLIIADPSRPRAAPIIETPVSLIDLYPTVLDIAGCRTVADTTQRSLLALLDGTPEDREPVLSTWREGNHSLRSGRWRYTRYKDGSEELYNHASDPREWRNLVEKPRFADEQRRFRKELARLVD